MKDDLQSQEYQRKRANALRTAWLLGFIALTIFGVFIAMTFLGR
jgi:hypothetical protein